MQTYGLYVRNGDTWELRFTVGAVDHREAFRKAMVLMSSDDYARPIRLEQFWGEIPGDTLPFSPMA